MGVQIIDNLLLPFFRNRHPRFMGNLSCIGAKLRFWWFLRKLKKKSLTFEISYYFFCGVNGNFLKQEHYRDFYNFYYCNWQIKYYGNMYQDIFLNNQSSNIMLFLAHRKFKLKKFYWKTWFCYTLLSIKELKNKIGNPTFCKIKINTWFKRYPVSNDLFLFFFSLAHRTLQHLKSPKCVNGINFSCYCQLSVHLFSLQLICHSL